MAEGSEKFLNLKIYILENIHTFMVSLFVFDPDWFLNLKTFRYFKSVFVFNLLSVVITKLLHDNYHSYRIYLCIQVIQCFNCLIAKWKQVEGHASRSMLETMTHTYSQKTDMEFEWYCNLRFIAWIFDSVPDVPVLWDISKDNNTKIQMVLLPIPWNWERRLCQDRNGIISNPMEFEKMIIPR